MIVKNKIIEITTETGINIYDITVDIQNFLQETCIKNGQITVFSCHTTTALAINEYEARLLTDIKVYLQKLAPKEEKYLHNDLHLRDVPPDEPENAHAHLMAINLLNTNEVIPIVEAKLALGTWQSVLFFELDGPRIRKVLLQIIGVQ